MEPQRDKAVEFIGQREGKCEDKQMTALSKDLFVRTWNVLHMYRAGALSLLLVQQHKYKAGIKALQEIHWTEEESQKKSIGHKSQNILGAGFSARKAS